VNASLGPATVGSRHKGRRGVRDHASTPTLVDVWRACGVATAPPRKAAAVRQARPIPVGKTVRAPRRPLAWGVVLPDTHNPGQRRRKFVLSLGFEPVHQIPVSIAQGTLALACSLSLSSSKLKTILTSETDSFRTNTSASSMITGTSFKRGDLYIRTNLMQKW
jgi:hypothetical protein